jgi:large subunit ribosomal protein L10
MKKVGHLIRENISDCICQGVQNRVNTFVVGYSKISSPQMNDLRKALSLAGAEMYVSKRRIAQKALESLDFNELSKQIDKQAAFIWSDKESVDVSKVLMKFSESFEDLSVQGAILEGKFIDRGEVKRLSSLPSREVLLTLLVQTIQSPLARLSSVLNGKTRELINLLKQLSEKSGGK